MVPAGKPSITSTPDAVKFNPDPGMKPFIGTNQFHGYCETRTSIAFPGSFA